MANTSQEMFNICRFCLCQDEAYLIPLTSLSEFAITMQDLVLFSGIQINADQTGTYAMCLECTNKLKISATFRNTCLSNDALFQELCAVLAASAESTRDETVEYLESDDIVADTDCLDRFDDESMEYYSDKWSPKSNQEVLYEEEYIQEYLQDTIPNVSEELVAEDDFSYSANYIELGESLPGDDESGTDNFGRPFYDNIAKRSHFVKRKGDIPLPAIMHGDAPNPIKTDYDWFEKDRPTGKRKQHLCDTCGLLTNHLKSHTVNHLKDFGETCPHCSKKFKHKTNLVSHIKTVHLKMIGKTCSICGKGFIHHKTYKYHMLTHQSEGKRFECKACSKTFVNAVYLRDHFNRLHNIARKN
ncbi:PR domain zinc finger protein 5-like [Anopheles marshallii]|uniref:PR domain zinc finger protein 5-like n=1 Tax=Anopheles marshallii TaxID=1521116 RepID=UPI00237C16B4|nr:PR domain zinc finger protein 5-like [Anopheles marshallii]